MKSKFFVGILALMILVLALPGAVSAADVSVSGSVVDEDLVVTAISPNVGVGAYMFANEPNVISVTVTNSGGLESAASTVSVVVGTDTYTAAIGTLAAGSSQTVTVTDTVSRPAGTVSITATADSAGVIAESNEANNAMTSPLTIYNNGYKGKRWTPELGGDMTTQVTYDGRYDVIYSSGDSVYASAKWLSVTDTWTSSDLSIPAGATVVSARLYEPYSYNKMGVDPAFTASFNGNSISTIAAYKDVKGFGSYSYPYGLYVYDVTSQFNTAGNTLVMTPEGTPGTTNDYALWGAYLIVTYSDPAATEKQIFINDEFDMVQSQSQYSVTTDEATVYATFAGVDTTGAANAQAIAILASAGDADKSKFFFNSNEYTGFWADYLSTPQIGFSVYDVTSALTSGVNEARLQSVDPGTKGDNMYAMNTILVIEKTEPAPVIDFSADDTTPVIGQTITFTATNTGGLVDSWAWSFGDGGTSTEQNPTHVYAAEGTYTVSLTATGPDYADTETKNNYIQVGAADISVTVTDPSIAFGTMANGETKTGSTTVNVDVTYGTAWSVTAADNDATTKGYMATPADVMLAAPFQLSNDGTNFQAMTSNFANFMNGAAGVDGSGTATVKQVIGTDAPGAYSITLTFTGSMA